MEDLSIISQSNAEDKQIFGFFFPLNGVIFINDNGENEIRRRDRKKKRFPDGSNDDLQDD